MEFMILGAAIVLCCLVGIVLCWVEEIKLDKQIARCEEELREQEYLMNYLREAISKETLRSGLNDFDE